MRYIKVRLIPVQEKEQRGSLPRASSPFVTWKEIIPMIAETYYKNDLLINHEKFNLIKGKIISGTQSHVMMHISIICTYQDRKLGPQMHPMLRATVTIPHRDIVLIGDIDDCYVECRDNYLDKRGNDTLTVTAACKWAERFADRLNTLLEERLSYYIEYYM